MKNIFEYLEKYAKEFPEKQFLKTNTEFLTYNQVYSQAKKISGILNRYEKKSIISIMFENSFEFIISYLGIIKSGHIAHIISPSISKKNLLLQIKLCDPEIIITSKKLIEVFRDVTTKTKFIDYNDFMKLDAKGNNSDSDIVSLIFTSGTTSEAKGAQIKHSNIIFTTNNILNVLGYKNSDIDVIPLSLSHSFGLGCFHTTLFTGGTLVLHKNSINILEILDSIKKNNATTFAAVPATLTSLVNNFPEKFSEKCNSLRLIITNSTHIPKNTVQKILKLLPNTKLATYYGLTEASRSTFMIFNKNGEKIESIGKAAPGVEIKIVKESDDSKYGEIWIKGKNVIQSYWKDQFPEKFDGEWIKTGDLGFFDNDEFLYLIGRTDFVINIGGEKVNPEEIEKVAKMIDSVEEAIAMGVFHESLGETVKLLVKTRKGQMIEKSEIVKHCKMNLERYKVPLEIEFVDDFPRNEYGKIIRRMIKADSNDRQF